MHAMYNVATYGQTQKHTLTATRTGTAAVMNENGDATGRQNDL